MKVLPVLDLLHGKVVRGIAGIRQFYQPIQSRLASGSDPLAIAGGLHAHLGSTEFYVADLDGILRGRPDLPVLGALCQEFAVHADTGIRRFADAVPVLARGVRSVVAGLETLEGPEQLRRLCEVAGADRVIFSLDLRSGVPLSNPEYWPQSDPLTIVRQAIGAGVTQVIVLDIAQVGSAGGVTTLPLCAAIRAAFERVTIVTGGGVRGADDLRNLARSGCVDGVLIASALHDETIVRADVEAVAEAP